jgi:chromosome segregation ATPase
MSDVSNRVAEIKAKISALETELVDAYEGILAARSKHADVSQRLKFAKASYQEEAKTLLAQLKDLTRQRKPYTKRAATPEPATEPDPTTSPSPEAEEPPWVSDPQAQ